MDHTQQDTPRHGRPSPSALQRADERETALRAALTNAGCSMESSATMFDEVGRPLQARYLRERAREAFSARDEALPGAATGQAAA